MYIPGTISARACKQAEPSIAYFYGHSQVSHQREDNLKKNYNLLVSELADAVNSRIDYELEYVKHVFPNSYDTTVNTYASGCVINFPSAGDTSILKNIVDCFKVNYVFIIDSEKMVSSLKERAEEYTLYNSLPKSGGVVNLDAQQR